MTKSRDLGNLAQTVAVNLPTALGTAGQTLVVNSGADGLEFGAASGGSGVTVYTGLSGTDGTPSGATYLLNASSPSAGDLAYVSSNTSLYQNNGNGWYRIAVINTTPTISSVADASSNTTPFTLEGGTNTVITVTASDADEGTDLTYSHSVTSGSLNGTTVTQGTGASENVFTITPHASNATTFSLTFTVSDNINAATSVAAFTLEFQITDSHFTSLLMATDGLAGDNNDISDSSSNNYTITPYGDVHAGTFSPYRHGGYSTYFDGSGDYLTISNDTSLNLANTSFTIECWVFPVLDYSNYRTIFSKRVSGSTTTSYHGYLANSTGYISFYNGTNYESSTVLASNAWSHCAWVYDGTNIKIFVNGTQVLSQTTSISEINEPLSIGFTRGTTEIFGGYISDFRIVKGTAVYTSNFTPTTTRLPTVSGTGYSTSLLTCHLPYIVDGSSNGHSITVNGDPETKPFGPYDYAEYSATNNGGSVYFDGSGDNYTVPNALHLGTSDFTFEFWIWPDEDWTNTSGKNLINNESIGSGTTWTLIVSDYNGYNGLTFSYGVYGSYTVGKYVNNYWVPQGRWAHLVAQRRNGTIEIYVNGVGQTLSTYNEGGTFSDSADLTSNLTTRTFFNGVKAYVSDLRLVTGSYVYDGDFTPPSGPLTTTGGTYPSTTNVDTSITASNTKLLIKGTDAHVIDKSQSANLKLAGTAAAVTNAPNNSNISSTNAASFDGDSDYVRVPYESIPSFGAGEFTIEGWIYMNNLSGNQIIVDKYASGNSQSFQIYYRSTGTSLTFYVGSSVLLQDPSSSTISVQTWHHFAVTRDSSGNVRLYVDGLKKAQSTSNVSFDSTVDLHLGVQGSTSTNYFNGYMQDVRLSNKAFYTADDESSNIPSTPLKG